MLNRKKFASIITAASVGMMIAGCSTVGSLTRKATIMPNPPKSPATKWQTIEDVLGSGEIKPNSTGQEKLPDFSKENLGINGFDGDEHGGPLLANAFWSGILPASQANKIKVADRTKTEKIIQELTLADSKFTSLSPTERAQKIGRYLNASYLWFGHITEYHSMVQSVTLSEVFLPNELERYKKEYADYINAVNTLKSELRQKIDDPVSAVLGVRNAYENDYNLLTQSAAAVKSTDDVESALKSRAITANVTSVGIAADVINVDTGEKIWVFDVSARGVTLEATNAMLIKAMLSKLFGNTPNFQ